MHDSWKPQQLYQNIIANLSLQQYQSHCYTTLPTLPHPILITAIEQPPLCYSVTLIDDSHP